MIYEQLQMSGLPNSESTQNKSQSFRRDSRASRTVLREKVEAIVTVVTCGARLQECSEKFNRDGSSVKILPVYLQDKISDISVEYSMTLPRWGIASGGEFGALVTSVRRTEESVSSCWVGTPTTCMTKRSERYKEGRTPNPVELAETFPTITVCGNYNRKGASKTSGDGLATYVRMYPTPMATQRGDCPAERRRHSPCLESVVAMQEPNGGKLNPKWVEWLMGFPLGWTDLDVSETQ